MRSVLPRADYWEAEHRIRGDASSAGLSCAAIEAHCFRVGTFYQCDNLVSEIEWHLIKGDGGHITYAHAV